MTEIYSSSCSTSGKRSRDAYWRSFGHKRIRVPNWVMMELIDPQYERAVADAQEFMDQWIKMGRGVFPRNVMIGRYICRLNRPIRKFVWSHGLKANPFKLIPCVLIYETNPQSSVKGEFSHKIAHRLGLLHAAHSGYPTAWSMGVNHLWEADGISAVMGNSIVNQIEPCSGCGSPHIFPRGQDFFVCEQCRDKLKGYRGNAWGPSGWSERDRSESLSVLNKLTGGGMPCKT